MHPTVKNQSTSPLIPNDSEDYQLTTTGDQSTNAKVDVSSDSFIFHPSILKEIPIDCENVYHFVLLFDPRSKITPVIQLQQRVKRQVSHQIKR